MCWQHICCVALLLHFCCKVALCCWRHFCRHCWQPTVGSTLLLALLLASYCWRHIVGGTLLLALVAAALAAHHDLADPLVDEGHVGHVRPPAKLLLRNRHLPAPAGWGDRGRGEAVKGHGKGSGGQRKEQWKAVPWNEKIRQGYPQSGRTEDTRDDRADHLFSAVNEWPFNEWPPCLSSLQCEPCQGALSTSGAHQAERPLAPVGAVAFEPHPDGKPCRRRGKRSS